MGGYFEGGERFNSLVIFLAFMNLRMNGESEKSSSNIFSALKWKTRFTYIRPCSCDTHARSSIWSDREREGERQRRRERGQDRERGREREREREKGRQREGERERARERQRETDRQTERESERQRDRETNIKT